MNFKQFLIEQHTRSILIENAELVYHKIIDHVDDGHIDYSDDKIIIDIGKLVKDSRLSNLLLVIRKHTGNSVKLGRKKDTDDFAIVVSTTKKLPERHKIDTFLSKSKDIFEEFKVAFNEYLKAHRDPTKVGSPSTYEKRRDTNDRESFENHYRALMSAVNARMEEYNKAKQELETELEQTVNLGRKATLQLAISKLKGEYFGDNSKAFLKIASDLEEGGFMQHLEKELRDKLHNRLEDFYEQKLS